MNDRFWENFQKPMEPVSYPRPFQNSSYIYQIKWDGVRIIALFDKGQVKLINKHGRDKTVEYEELQALAEMIEAKQAVLDGELVVLKQGRPSFPAVMRRDRCRDRNRIEGLKRILPVNYMVFDLLSLNGNDLMKEKLATRKKELENIVKPDNLLYPVEDFDNADLLFKAVKSMGMEGIVAKKKEGAYIPGKKHKDWLKIKCRRIQNCLAGGYTLRGGQVNSILLGAYHDADFVYIGKAANGLSNSQLQFLTEELPVLETAGSPFNNLRKPPSGYHFIEPRLGVKVEFLEWTEDLHLRHPVIKDFISVDPAGCNF